MTMLVTLLMGDGVLRDAWCVFRRRRAGRRRIRSVVSYCLSCLAMRMQGRRAMMTASSLLCQAFGAAGGRIRPSRRGARRLDAADAQGAGEVFEHELVGRLVVERAAGAGVFLLAGHGGGAVVEDDQHVAGGRRVVDHLDQAGDAAVDEGAVADDADHAAGLVGRQHVAQAQAHAEAGAHADAGVHGLEGRQHAQRVAADVAGDDAVQLAQGLEDDAVRAAVAELGRLAGRLAGSGLRSSSRMRRTRATFSSPKRYISALPSTCDAGGADGVGQVGIAFLDDHAASDALRRTARSSRSGSG